MSPAAVASPIAWFRLSDPHLLFGLSFAAGICLIYSDNLPTRIGGALLAAAAALAASGPPSDTDNWLVSLIWLAIALVVMAVKRPRWLRTR